MKKFQGDEGVSETPSITSSLLSDLDRYGSVGGPKSEKQLMYALGQLHNKRDRYESGDVDDAEALALYNSDPSRLRTFYPGLNTNTRSPVEQELVDVFPYLAGGTGAGLHYPERMFPGEKPKFQLDGTSKTGQKLVGKYVRDEKGNLKVVNFSPDVIDVINKENYPDAPLPNKQAGDETTMPTLHRDTRKHPYGNPKWKNFRMSLGFDGMNDNQKERYIEDRDAIAEWNNRPISELTEEEQTKIHELESAKKMHIETLREILPEGMKIEDWINNLRLREQDDYKRVYNDILNNTYEKPKKQDGGVLPEYQFGRAVSKLLPKVTKAAPRNFDNLNSLYRVVDVPFGSSSDEIAKAAIYGTTIPSMPTIGRRTGYSDIQRNTPFDVLNTTNSQNWIAGEGLGDRNSLINLYGGNNPYVVKMSRENPFADSETLTSINNRTDILKNFSWPYTQNVGKWNPTTGQYDLPLDLGEGVFTTVGKNADELAKIRPGSIVNPNYLSRDDNNITTIFGPKGMQVRQPQEILSAKDYLKRMTDNPNFTYKEGGNLPQAQFGQGLKQLIKSSSIGKGLKNAPLTVPLNYNTLPAANIINYTNPLPTNSFGDINQEALLNWDAAVLDNNFSKQADNFKLDIPLTRVLDSKGISIRDGKLFSKTGDHYYAPDFTSSRNTTHWSYGHIGDPGHGQWSKKSTAVISDFKTLKESGHAMDLNPTDTYFYSKDDFKIPDNSLILTRDKSLYDKIRLQTDLVNVKWVDPTQVDDKQFKALVDSYSTNGPEKYNYQGDLFNDYLHSNWKKGIDVAQYKPASYLSKNQRDFFGGGQSKMHGLDPLSHIESIQTKGYMKNHGLFGEIETWKDSKDFGKGIGTLDAMLEWPKPMQVLEMEKLLRLYKNKPEALRVQTELANLNGFKTYKEFKDSVSKAEMDNFKRYGGEQLPKAQFGKGLKKLQQKIRDNRVANTPVRDATSEEVLEMLSSFGPDSPMLQGEYDPREKEIVMYKDDLDTLKHEQVHASQYGPLQRMWYKMNDNGNDPAYKGARIQNKPMRKAYKQLTKGKNQVQDLLLPDNERTFNAAGQYVLNTGEEFEAVLNTGVNAAKSQGVNFNSSFDDVYSQLLNIKNPTNNMRGLTKFMSNKFTDAQKDIIFKAIQDEMSPAVPLPVMNNKL